MKRNNYGLPSYHCPILAPKQASRLRDFVDGFGAGWLCFGPVMVACLLSAWGWM